MARKPRICFKGAIYHVTQRGVARAPLFKDDADRKRFLLRLADAVEQEGIRLYLFCLMTNHVHLLLETPRGNLSRFMQRLQTAYTHYFNLRHGRVGHLMQGRYGAKPVQGDQYLLKLSRYVHLNPVAPAIIGEQLLKERIRLLREYPWSSYRGYAGLAKPHEFVDSEPIWAMMHAQPARRAKAYRKFVETGLATTDAEWDEMYRHAKWGLGDVGFQEEMAAALLAQAKAPANGESLRKVEDRKSPECVLNAVRLEFGEPPGGFRVRQYNCLPRSVAAWLLARQAQMTQREIADYLDMGTGAAVSLQLARLKSRLGQDPALAARVAKTSGRISKGGKIVNIVGA